MTREKAGRKPIRYNPTETQIRTQVREYLQWTGWFVFYHLQGGIGVYRGLPDLQAVKDGKTVYIEVKRPKGKLSEQQEKFKADVEAAGGTYIIARGIADVEHLAGEKQMQLRKE